MMAKNPHKRTLFMPLWDLEELQTAAKALDLAMDTSDTLLNYEEGALSVLDKVEQRYRTLVVLLVNACPQLKASSSHGKRDGDIYVLFRKCRQLGKFF